ncbi:MAG TPA: type II toxin-antitoxin system VapC family toxin [Jatrophihabitantaceae bacterium]
MSAFYVDTSAALKLLVAESDSQAFAQFYDDHADAAWVSSALLRIEVLRAVRRARPAALDDARDLLLAFDYVAIDDDVVEAAGNASGRTLRSLDAIHLVTAQLLDDDLTGLATYDDRLARAARSAGMKVVRPRD